MRAWLDLRYVTCLRRQLQRGAMLSAEERELGWCLERLHGGPYDGILVAWRIEADLYTVPVVGDQIWQALYEPITEADLTTRLQFRGIVSQHDPLIARDEDYEPGDTLDEWLFGAEADADDAD